MSELSHPLVASMLAGGAAGLITDVVLFPIDTVKTRLQTTKGFWSSGGFRGIYRGIGAISCGAIPSGATFYLVYEATKSLAGPNTNPVTACALGGAAGEVCRLLLAVPFEVTKQRAQAFSHLNSRTALLHTIQTEGVRGLYRGYSTNALRDAPYSLIQFPLWETIKTIYAKHCKQTKQSGSNFNTELTGMESGMCGGIAGGISAFITNPLDVAKTRIMLAEQGSPIAKMNPLQILAHISKAEGILGLLSGVTMRVAWTMCGGFLFIGVYDSLKYPLLRRESLKCGDLHLSFS